MELSRVGKGFLKRLRWRRWRRLFRRALLPRQKEKENELSAESCGRAGRPERRGDLARRLYCLRLSP